MFLLLTTLPLINFLAAVLATRMSSYPTPRHLLHFSMFSSVATLILCATGLLAGTAYQTVVES